MAFSTLVFPFVFLPVSLILYFVLPKRLKNAALVVCSLVFFAWGTPEYLVLMVLDIAFHYFAGRELALQKARGRSGRFVLVSSVLVNLLLLGFFKYYGFLVDNLNALLGTALRARELPMPIGVSFFTFSLLSYLFDVYRDRAPAARNVLDFSLYVTFFPKLVSGPIVQYAEMEPQLRDHPVTREGFGSGARLFLIGLAKKVLLANTLGTTFYALSALPMTQLSTLSAWLGAVCYALMLYFDFSGYSDMAIGLASMFGFRFGKNFDYPYVSQSITEFWRRWHISLGAWMRDYLFYPFALTKPMQRFGKWATSHWGKHFGRVLPAAVANLLVFAVVGIWHGPQAHYLAWGLYNGLVIALADLLEPAFKKLNTALHIPTESRGWHVFRIVRTFIIVNIGWYFDRNEFVQGCIYLHNTFTNFNLSALAANAPGAFAAVSGPAWGLVIISTLLVFAHSVLKEQGRDPYAEVQRLPLALRWGLYYLVIFMVLLSFICVNETVGFLYANF